MLVSDGTPFICASCPADAIANGGTITKDTGTGIATIAVGAQGPGTVRSQAGTLQLGSFGVQYRFTDTAQIASGAGQVQLVNVELVDGTTHALTGANVRMSASSNLLQGAGDLELDTTFQWFAGTMEGTGTTTVLAGRRLELFPETMSAGAGTRTLSRRLANFGTVKYQGGPLTITATGQLDNFPTGEVLVSDGTPFVCSSCPEDAIANGGTITKEIGSGIASIAVGAQGPGDVRSLSGTLQLGAFGIVYHFTDTGEIDPGAGEVQLVNADVVDGTAFARAGANVRMSAGSNVLAGDGTFQIEGVFRWFAGTMQGTGTTHVAATGRIELFPESPSAGAGTRTLSRPLTNSGTVDYQDGPLTITSTGNLNNQPTGAVLVSDGTPFICAGCPTDAITNGGTITKDTGTGIASISVGTTGPGRVHSLAGTLQLGALGVLFRVTDNAEIASGAGQVQLINVEVVGGTAFARSGANVRMSAGSNVLQGAGTFQIEGLFQWFAGTMQGAGTTHVAAGGRLDLFPETPSAGIGTRTLSRPLTNAGTVDYQDGPVTITSGGQFTNNAGGLFLVSDGPVLSCSGCAGALTNAGTIHKDAGTGTAVLDLPLTTSGTVHAEHGIVRFAAYTQTAAGTMRVHLGGTTVGTGYTRVAATGAATLAGTLDIVTDSGFTAAEGDTFQVMTFASRSGTFGTIVGGPPVYTVQHNATDVTVTKPLSNHDPVANANGPYAVDEGSSVGLTGSGTDADGDTLTYAWDLDNNGTFETRPRTRRSRPRRSTGRRRRRSSSASAIPTPRATPKRDDQRRERQAVRARRRRRDRRRRQPVHPLRLVHRPRPRHVDRDRRLRRRVRRPAVGADGHDVHAHARLRGGGAVHGHRGRHGRRRRRRNGHLRGHRDGGELAAHGERRPGPERERGQPRDARRDRLLRPGRRHADLRVDADRRAAGRALEPDGGASDVHAGGQRHLHLPPRRPRR